MDALGKKLKRIRFLEKAVEDSFRNGDYEESVKHMQERRSLLNDLESPTQSATVEPISEPTIAQAKVTAAVPETNKKAKKKKTKKNKK